MLRKKAPAADIVQGIFVTLVDDKIEDTHGYTQSYVTTDGRSPAICREIGRIESESQGRSFNDLKGSVQRRLRSCPQEGLTVTEFKDTDIDPGKIQSKAPRWMPEDVHRWVKENASTVARIRPNAKFKVIFIKLAAN